MDQFIGEIRAFPYSFAPDSWMACDGSLLPIAEYQVLYAVIGNRFGGDGYNTFALPDLRGHVAIGAGAGPGLTPRNLADQAGQAAVALTSVAQLPAHAHAVTAQYVDYDKAPTAYAAAATANVSYPSTYVDTSSGAAINMYSPAAAPVTMAPAALAATTGTAVSHENRQPFLAFRFCIAVQGVFPVRS